MTWKNNLLFILLVLVVILIMVFIGITVAQIDIYIYHVMHSRFLGYSFSIIFDLIALSGLGFSVGWLSKLC